MLKFRTTEEISGIKFLDLIKDSTDAVGELFNKFPNSWQKNSYKSIMLTMFDSIKFATLVNVTIAKTKHEEVDKLQILDEIHIYIEAIKDLLQIYLDNPPEFVGKTDRKKVVTLENIKNTQKLLLETLKALENLRKFEVKTLDKLNS